MSTFHQCPFFSSFWCKTREVRQKNRALFSPKPNEAGADIECRLWIVNRDIECEPRERHIIVSDELRLLQWLILNTCSPQYIHRSSHHLLSQNQALITERWYTLFCPVDGGTCRHNSVGYVPVTYWTWATLSLSPHLSICWEEEQAVMPH